MQKRKDIRNFYLDETFIPTYEKFKEIVSREGQSVSDKLRSMISDYVRLHEPGNPQQRLDTIMDLGKPYNAHKCNMCDLKPVMLAFVGKKSVLLCQDHFDRKKAWFTGWKELPK